MSEILLCNKCYKFPANINILEIEKTICKLCEIETHIYFQRCENFEYYPPKNYKKIEVFDDGNQKYQHEPNRWLQIGHDKNHPEKIILVNDILYLFNLKMFYKLYHIHLLLFVVLMYLNL